MKMTFNRDGVVFLVACMTITGILGFWLGYHTAYSDTTCPKVENTKVVSSSYNWQTGDDSCVYIPIYARTTIKKTWRRRP